MASDSMENDFNAKINNTLHKLDIVILNIIEENKGQIEADFVSNLISYQNWKHKLWKYSVAVSNTKVFQTLAQH